MSRALRRAIVPALVLAGGVIARGQLGIPALLGWAALAGLGFSIAGEAVREVDQGPATPRSSDGHAALRIYAGFVFGTVMAMLVSGTAVLVGILGFAAVVAFQTVDRRTFGTELLISLLVGFPLMYGAIAVGLAGEGVLPWTLAAWLALVLQLVSKVEQDGPAGVRGSRANPLTIGTAALSIALVPASLIWPAHASYHGAYFVIALFAELCLLAAATRLLVGRTDRLSFLVRGAAVVGLIALVAGRIG